MDGWLFLVETLTAKHLNEADNRYAIWKNDKMNVQKEWNEDEQQVILESKLLIKEIGV